MEDPVQQVEALDVSDARRSEKTQHARTTLRLCLLTVCFALVLVPFKSPLGLPDRTIRSRNVPTQNSDRSLLHTPRMCSANEVVGNFINTTFFGIDGCVLHFVDVPSHFSALVDGTKKRLWIHFVGDSDTRGLVLGLLRLLYTPLRTAVTRDEFAKAYGCWDESIGRCPGIDLHNLARLGYIDFQFLIEAGVLKYQKAFVRGKSTTDAQDAQDLRADHQYGLRISHTFEGPDGEFINRLKYWTDDHNTSVPDIFYLNLGAWFSKGETNITTIESVTSLIGKLQEQTESDIIYGSALSWRSHLFDGAVARMMLLKQSNKMHLFDRSVFSGILMEDLKLDRNSGHAPFIENLFDAQRLLQLLLAIFLVPVKSSFIPHSFSENCSIALTDDFIGTWSQHCEWA